MSIANPLFSLEEGPNGSAAAAATSASAAAAAAQAAALRDRLKKSTMACEMCRKRKVHAHSPLLLHVFILLILCVLGEMYLFR